MASSPVHPLIRQELIVLSYTPRVDKDWNRLPRELMEAPSLEVFKKCVDVALREMV